MDLLRNKGTNVYYADPFVYRFQKMREYYFELESIEISKQNLQRMDCVLISTDNDDFDYGFILDNSRLIIDTRNVYKEKYTHVIKA